MTVALLILWSLIALSRPLGNGPRRMAMQTAIIATADHAQAFDVFGSVDTQYLNALPNDDTNLLGAGKDSGLQFQKHLAIGEYDSAGWVDLVTDENGLPTKWNGRYRLASGKVDGLQSEENWQVREVPDRASNPLARQAVQPNDTLALALGLPVGTTVLPSQHY
ncbi:hypothetical protein BASA60_002918 [Batrachochytrium salamandrivorans]|nr:hypothetical protein BASA60_002918 [Batrachochytrium salamandrivorans]